MFYAVYYNLRMYVSICVCKVYIIPGSTGGLVYRPALLLPLPVANLLNRLVALSHLNRVWFNFNIY